MTDIERMREDLQYLVDNPDKLTIEYHAIDLWQHCEALVALMDEIAARAVDRSGGRYLQHAMVEALGRIGAPAASHLDALVDVLARPELCYQARAAIGRIHDACDAEGRRVIVDAVTAARDALEPVLARKQEALTALAERVRAVDPDVRLPAWTSSSQRVLDLIDGARSNPEVALPSGVSDALSPHSEVWKQHPDVVADAAALIELNPLLHRHAWLGRTLEQLGP